MDRPWPPADAHYVKTGAARRTHRPCQAVARRRESSYSCQKAPRTLADDARAADAARARLASWRAASDERSRMAGEEGPIASNSFRQEGVG